MREAGREPSTMNFMRRWPYTFAIALSLVVGVTAIASSLILDLPLKDPEGFLGPAYVRLPVMGLAFFAAGIVPIAIMRHGMRNIPAGVVRIVREEWTLRRVVYIATGLIAFYACYVSYRNLKSYLPVIREGVLFDAQMLRLDHWLLFGHNPAEVLHNLLGTDVAAQVLAFVYVSYLPLIPLSLAAFLVLNRNLTIGAWYATALGLNWVLGTISYYILPTLGPAFAQQQSFTDLPDTGVSDLQQSLFRARVDVLADPWASEKIHGIAGFASLHVSVVFTACLFFMRTGQKAFLQYLAWIFLVLTMLATIYFGWHYLLDDIGGLFIGWLSVSIGAWATGNRGRRRRRRSRPLDDASPMAASATSQPLAPEDAPPTDRSATAAAAPAPDERSESVSVADANCTGPSVTSSS